MGSMYLRIIISQQLHTEKKENSLLQHHASIQTANETDKMQSDAIIILNEYLW